MSNKVIVDIKRNWLGKPIRVEVRLETPDVEPDRKPVLELLELASAVFGVRKEKDEMGLWSE